MFNWFWEFLYSISKILYRIIDGLLSIANKLCGIEPIVVAGKKTDFMIFLLTNNQITYGLGGAVLISIFLLMMFGVFAMCKAAKDGKKTSGQVTVQIFKTLGMYLFIPAVMIIFTLLVNALVQILYQATMYGSTSMGDFLFRSFLPGPMQDMVFDIDYTNTSAVKSLMSSAGYGLSKYEFFFSWLVCIPLIFTFAKSLFLFVERCLSIAILYVISPIAMSATVLDDGQVFKKWREQVLGKYLTGFGMIIGLNIYIIVMANIVRGDVKFFDNGFLNFLFKATFILGGSFFLQKVYSLIGSLINSNARGDLYEAERAAGGVGKLYQGAFNLATSPFRKKDKDKDKDKKGGGKKDTTKNGLGLFGGAGGSNYNGMQGFALAFRVATVPLAAANALNPDNNKDGGKSGSSVKNAITGGSGGAGGSKDDKGSANNNKNSANSNLKNIVSGALSKGAK